MSSKKIGDVVRLNSGSPKMTISQIGKTGLCKVVLGDKYGLETEEVHMDALCLVSEHKNSAKK